MDNLMLKMGSKASKNSSNLPPLHEPELDSVPYALPWWAPVKQITCWAVPWELEPVVVESAVSLQSLPPSLPAACFLQSFQQRHDWTFYREHDQSFGGLRGRWAKAASLQLCFSCWLSSWRRNHQLPLSPSSLLSRRLSAPSLLSGLPLHSLLSVNRGNWHPVFLQSQLPVPGKHWLAPQILLFGNNWRRPSQPSLQDREAFHFPWNCKTQIQGVRVWHKCRDRQATLLSPLGPIWASSLGPCYSLPSGPIPIYPQKDSWCFFCVLVSCDHYSYWSSQWFLSKVFDF